MFLIEVSYTKPISEVDRCLEAHREYLGQKISEGLVIFAGRKNPREGGLIFLNTDKRAAVDDFIVKDPFHREQVAEYRVVDVTVTAFDKRFECFLKK